LSIELLPIGKACNIACNYCYQQDERTVTQNKREQYDLEKMQQALLLEGVGKQDGRGGITGWSLFGGESLLFPINDFERMLEWSATLNAPVSVQTNGALITDRHIELFKRFHVGIGFSIDGPDDLNDARQAMNPKATRAITTQSLGNLSRLMKEGLRPSLIVTLTSVNVGTDEKLDRLIAWLLNLRDTGLRYVNLHTLEPHGDVALAMTQERQIEVMRRLRLELVGFASVSPFTDMEKSLLRESGSNCVWNFCDPYTTDAVRGIDGQGGRGNCGRTNKDGVNYVKSATSGRERQLALYLTPQDAGGCAECRFFIPCGGGSCPGEGIDGDWRNRTVHCQSIKALMGDMEAGLVAQGKDPISVSLRRPGMEAQMLGQWMGKPVSVAGDRPHGDSPHGDMQHGDHTDAVKPVITHGDSDAQ